jgi:hypothetical protein
MSRAVKIGLFRGVISLNVPSGKVALHTILLALKDATGYTGCKTYDIVEL